MPNKIYETCDQTMSQSPEKEFDMDFGQFCF